MASPGRVFDLVSLMLCFDIKSKTSRSIKWFVSSSLLKPLNFDGNVKSNFHIGCIHKLREQSFSSPFPPQQVFEEFLRSEESKWSQPPSTVFVAHERYHSIDKMKISGFVIKFPPNASSCCKLEILQTSQREILSSKEVSVKFVCLNKLTFGVPQLRLFARSRNTRRCFGIQKQLSSEIENIWSVIFLVSFRIF